MSVAKKLEKVTGLPVADRPHRLSKSRYCTGVQCPKALYLKVHSPELGAPIDDAKQMIFDQGTAVGIEARKRYPGGILIDFDHRHQEQALTATEEALAHNPPAIFEAAFFYRNTLVRIDILKNNGDGTWDIIEVKSSVEMKEEHIPDIAIQRFVAEGAGLVVDKVWLKHLNRECVFPNLENLFAEVDATHDVQQHLISVPGRVDELLKMLALPKEPKCEIGPHCGAPYECDFKPQCWAHIPEHSVFELNGVWEKTKFELYRRGIIRIQDIPVEEKVSRAKQQQLKAVRENRPVIDIEGLRAFLKTFQYPLYFFDFETINPAIPQYAGLRPYSQVPFQYSCHVIDYEGAPVRHVEYLADGSIDPRSEIADRMIKDLGTNGTILAYNQSFERTRIAELAAQLPSKANELNELLSRFLDLKDAFSKHFYHPDFHGSFSIKDVLPTLVPSMTYEGMEVADGGNAQVAYQKICDPKTPTQERAKYREDLIAYCSQDTLAMVELFFVLKQIR